FSIQRDVNHAQGHSGSNQKSARSRCRDSSRVFPAAAILPSVSPSAIFMSTARPAGVFRRLGCRGRDRACHSTGMPGTNLTREEARQRAATVATESYVVELDLSGDSTQRFTSTTTLSFSARSEERRVGKEGSAREGQ